MSAIKKEELEKLEAEYGLEPDGLTYQHRCSRITAVMKGEEWTAPVKRKKKQAGKQNLSTGYNDSEIKHHSLYGKKILIAPMMRPDAKRNLAFDEKLGPELTVREFAAGEQIYNQPENVTQMFGEYEIVSRDESKQVIAKTTFPKIGTEISYTIGMDLVPVVRGNSGETGYIWSFPSCAVQVEDTLVQLYGLKTLIQQIYPELLEKFSGKPMMSYIDGVTLAANIPLTDALLRQQARKELIDERAGINYR